MMDVPNIDSAKLLDTYTMEQDDGQHAGSDLEDSNINSLKKLNLHGLDENTLLKTIGKCKVLKFIDGDEFYDNLMTIMKGTLKVDEKTELNNSSLDIVKDILKYPLFTNLIVVPKEGESSFILVILNQ
jgi:hypothetical protein